MSCNHIAVHKIRLISTRYKTIPDMDIWSRHACKSVCMGICAVVYMWTDVYEMTISLSCCDAGLTNVYLSVVLYSLSLSLLVVAQPLPQTAATPSALQGSPWTEWWVVPPQHAHWWRKQSVRPDVQKASQRQLFGRLKWTIERRMKRK